MLAVKVNHKELLRKNCKNFNKNKVKLLLNSGCINHFTCSDRYFYKSVILKGPVDVKGGLWVKEQKKPYIFIFPGAILEVKLTVITVQC